MIISTTQFRIHPINQVKDFWTQVENRCQEAQAKKSKVILFPEYFFLCYLMSFSPPTFQDCLKSSLSHEFEFLKNLLTFQNVLIL